MRNAYVSSLTDKPSALLLHASNKPSSCCCPQAFPLFVCTTNVWQISNSPGAVFRAAFAWHRLQQHRVSFNNFNNASCCTPVPAPRSIPCRMQTIVQQSVVVRECVGEGVWQGVCEGVEGHIKADPTAVGLRLICAFLWPALCVCVFNLLAALKMHLPRLLLLIRHVLRSHLLFMKSTRTVPYAT